MPSFLKDAYNDKDLKKRRGYTNAKSKVFSDGREILHAEDWDKRKEELRRRAHGRCERWTVLKKEHAPGCYGAGHEPHHITRRWPERDDRLENLAYLSHACHCAEDPRKIGGRK